MAYNNLSGTVFLPDKLTTRLTLASGSIISGNLDYSNGERIINVPRVGNAGDNRLVTNVSGDSNTFTCESNLIFDGDTLSVTGDITASVGVSASIFVGDGSRLFNLPAGTDGGIFTEISSNRAFTTSSVQIGSDTTPANTLSVAGSSYLSGAVIHKRHFTNSNYVVAVSDFYIGADSTSNPVVLSLPTASATTDGQTFIFKDEGGNANNNNITISCSVGGDKIDGKNLIVLESPYASVQLYCNGTNKYFIC